MCLFSHDTSSSKAVSGEEVRSADSGGHVLWEVIILTVLVLCRLRAVCCREPALLRVSPPPPPKKNFTVGEKVGL